MTIYKYWNAGPLAAKTADEVRKYTFDEIKDKYSSQWSFGLDNLLNYGYIMSAGWIQDFTDKGELKYYLYDSSIGTGKAWAPNVKCLEKALGHKVYRAFDLGKK